MAWGWLTKGWCPSKMVAEQMLTHFLGVEEV